MKDGRKEKKKHNLLLVVRTLRMEKLQSFSAKRIKEASFRFYSLMIPCTSINTKCDRYSIYINKKTLTRFTLLFYLPRLYP